MPIDPQHLGRDLWLLDPPDRGDDRRSGGDLHLTLRPSGVDLATIEGVDNLAQALLLRFLTPRGALAELGHPEYGSRLFTLIGELNNETNRNRARLYVLEALSQEPRIGRVVAVSVTTNRRAAPTRIDIAISAIVAETEQVLNLVFPFFLS
ncbi:MAG: GPW/gp25 family protein [Chloroflexi bacterium]|nr:GPW/gp25 family protein [Chloroflexota bacterium]